MRNRSLACLAAALALQAGAADAELAFFAYGEELATEGFLELQLTRDGWEIRFEQILVTLGPITAYQVDPPFAAAGGRPQAATQVTLDPCGPITLDLTARAEDRANGRRVHIGSAPTPEGHYNALEWSVVPAPSGEWRGKSMIFIGTARRDGTTLPLTLTSDDRHPYSCGEYVGEGHKGFVPTQGRGELELTFHLDHISGGADRAAGDPMNTGAPGFDAFAAGGMHEVDLSGLHIGHVEEGHCATRFE
ncbi:hypothetical protein [Pseudogemmobacter sonorensis]|uniref:hypothetical protein n=1 Tax=Pseudogemmobacter sonorensis TaxID=2989681 RepID=UPI0036B9A4DE